MINKKDWGTSMRVEYKNTFRDLIVFNWLHQLASPMLNVIVLLVTMSVGYSYLTWNYSTGITVTATLLTYILLWIIQFVSSLLMLISKKNHAFLTDHVIEIQEDAFYEETKYGRTFSYWFGLVSVKTRGGAIAVYVTQHMAHIIPRRAFSSKTHRDEFLALLQAKMKQQPK